MMTSEEAYLADAVGAVLSDAMIDVIKRQPPDPVEYIAHYLREQACGQVKPMMTSEEAYLADAVGAVLSDAMIDVIKRQPPDPVEYIAHYLREQACGQNSPICRTEHSCHAITSTGLSQTNGTASTMTADENQTFSKNHDNPIDEHTGSLVDALSRQGLAATGLEISAAILAIPEQPGSNRPGDPHAAPSPVTSDYGTEQVEALAAPSLAAFVEDMPSSTQLVHTACIVDLEDIYDDEDLT